jgi:hypothetical protein
VLIAFSGGSRRLGSFLPLRQTKSSSELELHQGVIWNLVLSIPVFSGNPPPIIRICLLLLLVKALRFTFHRAESLTLYSLLEIQDFAESTNSKGIFSLKLRDLDETSEIPTGAYFGHSYIHGSGPHEIVVCIPRSTNNEVLFEKLLSISDV